MKYKIITLRPSHQTMKKMIGTNLYALYQTDLHNNSLTVVPCLITGITIGKNDKWEFTFDNEEMFSENEPLFANAKSAKRWAKKYNYTIK